MVGAEGRLLHYEVDLGMKARPLMSNSVFVLWHIHVVGADDDAKLIGVYKSNQDAKSAIARLSSKPGFRAAPDGFKIEEYEIGKDHWTDGFGLSDLLVLGRTFPVS